MNEITIKLKDVSIKGSLSSPLLARGFVIFVHESGGSRFSDRDQFVARVLERGGIGYLLFDLLSDEEEQKDLGTQEFRANVPFLTSRLLAVTRWVKEQEGLSELPLGYLGMSTGAAAVLCAAAIEPSIKAVVLQEGESDLTEGALENVSAPTLLLVGGKDLEVLELNKKILEKLNCPKDLKIIGGVTKLFKDKGALEIAAMNAFNWFTVHFGGLKRKD